MNILIPIHGKMTARQFLNEYTYSYFIDRGFNVIPLLPSKGESFPYEPSEIRYAEAAMPEGMKVQKILTIGRSLAAGPTVANWRKKIYFHDAISTTAFSGNVWALQMLYAMAPRNRSIYRFLSQVEQLYFSQRREYKHLLKNIDIVLNPGIGSLGYAAFNPILHYAISRKVPTVSYIPNYDNLTVRGFRAFCPDLVCVWGKSMNDEAEAVQKIPKKRIRNVGSTLYDYYYHHLEKLMQSSSRGALLAKFGLDHRKNTILYAFGENTLGNVKLATHIIEACSRYNLIIRTHPSPNISNREFLQVIRFLAEHGRGPVYVSNAAQNLGLQGGAGSNDIDELIEMLFVSDLVLSHFSTITLESCILKKQVIEMDYDGFAYDPRRSGLSGLPHNTEPLRKKATFTASRMTDIVPMIGEMLRGNGVSEADMDAYVRHICGPIDGRATSRLCEELFNLHSQHDNEMHITQNPTETTLN